MRSRTWLALPLYFFGSWAFAQQASRPDLSLIDLDSLLKAHAHQLRSAESRFNENGFAFLLHEIGDAQVVAIAEEHNTAEIPQFAAMLFERLHRSLGFDYLPTSRTLTLCSSFLLQQDARVQTRLLHSREGGQRRMRAVNPTVECIPSTSNWRLANTVAACACAKPGIASSAAAGKNAWHVLICGTITVDPARPTRIVAKRRYFVASGQAREA
jgi:hypothetical protein